MKKGDMIGLGIVAALAYYLFIYKKQTPQFLVVGGQQQSSDTGLIGAIGNSLNALNSQVGAMTRALSGSMSPKGPSGSGFSLGTGGGGPGDVLQSVIDAMKKALGGDGANVVSEGTTLPDDWASSPSEPDYQEIDPSLAGDYADDGTQIYNPDDGSYTSSDGTTLNDPSSTPDYEPIDPSLAGVNYVDDSGAQVSEGTDLSGWGDGGDGGGGY